KSAQPVYAYDIAAEPLERLSAHGVKPAASVREIAACCEVVFLSLPGAPEVKQVCADLLAPLRPGSDVIDLSTVPVALARELDALAKGSADSFALRHHGMHATVPNAYPEKAFSVQYALKDVSYALELGQLTGVALSGLKHAKALLEKAAVEGHAAEYFPVIAKVI